MAVYRDVIGYLKTSGVLCGAELWDETEITASVRLPN